DIYEHLVYEGEHIPLATMPGMAERTVSIHSMSKTYSVTGWRIGWAIASPPLSDAIRKVHDFLTVGAAAPLQEAAVVALGLPAAYYRQLAENYRARRDLLLSALEQSGFVCFKPDGAYYIMTDISGFGFSDDTAFARHLIQSVGVAAVPGSSFYHRPEDGARKLRFTFCKREETLRAAAERLALLKRS
ncbi:MAG TPA: aminotransferase class I/II-fold pyridoxal phosphate-dependent enzyme, partial [Vicinamibacteria bacterium]